MKFGPLNPFDISLLEERLKKAGVQYSLEGSAEDAEEFYDRVHSRPPTRNPQYDGPAPYLYIEIPDDAVELVRFDLEKMAIFPVASTGNELDEDDETALGLKNKNAPTRGASSSNSGTVRLLLFALIAAAIYFVYRNFIS